MNIPLLRKVQRAILKHPDQFEMDYWFQNNLLIGRNRKLVPAGGCGTAGCIGGWAQHIAGKFKTLKDTRRSYLAGSPADLLNLNYGQGGRLFGLSEWPKLFKKQYRTFKSPAARARVCARRIDHFIKTEGAE